MEIQFTNKEKDTIIQNVIDTMSENIIDYFSNSEFYFDLDNAINIKELNQKIAKEVNKMFTPWLIKDISKKQFERIVENYLKDK